MNLKFFTNKLITHSWYSSYESTSFKFQVSIKVHRFERQYWMEISLISRYVKISILPNDD